MAELTAALAAAHVLTSPAPCLAAGLELEIPYPVFLDMIERKLLDDEGRHYLRGSAETPCNYAFVDAPAVAAEGGRLQVTLRFSGRAAARVAKRCIGPADSFQLTMSGRPVFADGAIVIEEIEYDSPNRVYATLLDAFLEQSLPTSLHFPLLQVFDRLRSLRQISGQTESLYEVRLSDLSVTSVDVTGDGLAIRGDIRLTVGLVGGAGVPDDDG